jgi:deoxyadenosine/deoxycytidine kinase
VNFDLIQEIYFENLLFHSFELEKLLDSSDVIVLDRGFEDTLAVAKYFSEKGVFNNFTKYELKLSNFKKYFSDFIIFLYAEINAIKLRKENRDNYLGRSKRPNDDVFIDEISMFYTKWYKTNTKAFFVDTSLAKPFDVALLILEIINKEIKSDGIQ